ncbi:retropepsin-like aspartic protease family protein [Neosynechococcus sphagnicola]|uniref:retropepsin-like aspartic protease family protein n=1 Tax=Neosynechococcus sphagnicola TaxID=1501145 RepID=UPI00068AB784|nr:retropepsin-like aspartic protease [Neosynechococcus sphagnicola]
MKKCALKIHGSAIALAVILMAAGTAAAALTPPTSQTAGTSREPVLTIRPRSLIAQRNSNWFIAPIVKREGGIPVIQVTFNNGERYPMMVDTGASITTITPEMARVVGFRQTGTANLTLAHGGMIKAPAGIVPSIRVGGAVMTNFDVVVIDSSPLLGQNFYRSFNMTIREKAVIFRPRQ